jgi:hypothetical protein
MAFSAPNAIKHIHENADTKGFGYGRCAEYTRKAIEAGGITLHKTLNAQNYGEKLIKAGFKEVASGKDLLAGDVVIIEGFPGNKYGHMAMFDGQLWYSDFKQNGLYPGPGYRKHKPKYKIYRYYSELPTNIDPLSKNTK